MQPSVILGAYEHIGQLHKWSVIVHSGFVHAQAPSNVQLALVTETGNIIHSMDVGTFDGQFCFSYDGQIDCHCKFQ